LSDLKKGPKIGVLALQGDFEEHIGALRKLGLPAIEVRNPDYLDELDGLIIPGGESTTIARLIKIFNFEHKIKNNVKRGMALWGTCAGMILIANDLTDSYPTPLGLLDITVSRNWFGRQVDSFESNIVVKGLGNQEFRAVFIRAPIVQRVGENVEILAKLEKSYPVAVRSQKILATAFHPELTDDLRFHKMFLNMSNKKHKASNDQKHRSN